MLKILYELLCLLNTSGDSHSFTIRKCLWFTLTKQGTSRTGLFWDMNSLSWHGEKLLHCHFSGFCFMCTLVCFLSPPFTVFVLIVAHAPKTAHPSYFVAVNHKIINHLPRSIHETNILCSIWLGSSLKMAQIINVWVDPCNKYWNNKHSPRMTYVSVLGTYWNEYGNFWLISKLIAAFPILLRADFLKSHFHRIPLRSYIQIVIS